MLTMVYITIRAIKPIFFYPDIEIDPAQGYFLLRNIMSPIIPIVAINQLLIADNCAISHQWIGLINSKIEPCQGE